MDACISIFSVALYEGLVFGLLSIAVYLTFRVLDFPDLGVDATFPLGGSVAAVFIVNGVNRRYLYLQALSHPGLEGGAAAWRFKRNNRDTGDHCPCSSFYTEKNAGGMGAAGITILNITG